MVPRFVLASRSPRRRELLRAAGFEFDVVAADVPERRAQEERPADYVRRLAREKAEAIAMHYPGRLVLGADTEVVLDDDVLGKPADADDAARLLRRLSGVAHEVLTAVAIVWQGQVWTTVETTTVWIDDLTDEEIAEYVATGEPMDKAGAYGIQGYASRFIPRIDGSYSNVVGLPVAAVLQLLRRAGLA
jgi:septum formation protein